MYKKLLKMPTWKDSLEGPMIALKLKSPTYYKDVEPKTKPKGTKRKASDDAIQASPKKSPKKSPMKASMPSPKK